LGICWAYRFHDEQRRFGRERRLEGEHHFQRRSVQPSLAKRFLGPGGLTPRHSCRTRVAHLRNRHMHTRGRCVRGFTSYDP
jgi:hypothetical protein